MKTTRQKLLNIVITMSVTINLVMLGGLAYLASLNNDVKNIYTAMDSPVVVYVPKAMETQEAKTLMKLPTKS